jgi:hypothetical protein
MGNINTWEAPGYLKSQITVSEIIGAVNTYMRNRSIVTIPFHSTVFPRADIDSKQTATENRAVRLKPSLCPGLPTTII